jgi:plastocyanin
VKIEGNLVLPAFTPDKVSIYATDAVVWTWTGLSGDHSVTFDPGQRVTFDSDPDGSPNHPNGDTFKRTFNLAGAFTYHCKLHPEMTGTVYVSPLPGQAPAISSLAVNPASACTGRRCRRPSAVLFINKNAYLEGRIELRRAGGGWRKVRGVGPVFVRRGRNRIALPTNGLSPGSYRVVARALDNLSRYSRPKRAGFRLVAP